MSFINVISKYHPEQPIFALSTSKEVSRALNLYWGVFPVEVDLANLEDEVLRIMPVMEQQKDLALNKKDKLLIIWRDPNTENLNLKVVSVGEV
jgi:pyruvate kinase